MKRIFRVNFKIWTIEISSCPHFYP